LRRRFSIVGVSLSLLVAACAPKVIPPLPEGEDYVAPVVEPGEVSERDARDLEKAWTRVLTGETAAAVREYQKILRRSPGLVAAETGLGYARLRAGDAASAAVAFAGVLEGHPDNLPALVGAGSAAFHQGDLDQAFARYRHALDVAPDDPLVKKRAAELKLQVADRHMAAGKAAQAAGEDGRAVDEYETALDAAPELASLRLALADLLVARGESSRAVATLEEDPLGDRDVSLRLGGVLLAEEEYEQAQEVYREILARAPTDEEALRGERAAQEALDFEAQPDEYRRIGESPRATRADLAALLAVKVTALSRLSARQPRVAVDIAGSWAREHIATVVGLGIMDVYPNHTFQPQATVRRADLARAASRVLERLNRRVTAGAAPTDMSASHLDQRAVTRVVGAGLMSLGPDGRFEPWRPVGGREAVDVVEGLATLVGP